MTSKKNTSTKVRQLTLPTSFDVPLTSRLPSNQDTRRTLISCYHSFSFLLKMETYRTHIVMWTVLGLAAVFLSASAHLERLQAIVGQNVLLHCPCEKTNERTDIKWQLEDHTIVLHHNNRNNTTTIGEGYENRVSLFLNEDRGNCSLLLSGITVADNGMYKCYIKANTWNYFRITLHVAASYSVCMHQVPDKASVGSGGGEGFGVYQCKASGGYPTGQIHWKMDGHPLVNISRRDETHLDNSTGLYSLTSNLTMELSQGEKLQCMVKNTYHASNLSSSCNETPGSSRNSLSKVAVGVSVSVVVMLVAGVLLVIFLLTRCHRRERPTQRDTEEGNVTQPLNIYEDSV
ncbi:CD276 antigen isoform X2 [Coregonus clupeaformis]|uniref:CD276 antigen isoform X2 n=1 Tax=Coregonus clupeaformis TaxID=59861 RepID=UPI001BE0C490|nr:CD276 antigen isoform X2 [Coregonus clupeaformis]